MSRSYSYFEGALIERPARNHPNREAWEEMRRLVFKEQEGRCATCPGPFEELHHRHYNNFGNEAREDVVGLCRLCHEAITSRLRACRYEQGQLSTIKIAELVSVSEAVVFRPPPKTVDIPSSVNSEEPARFRPKLREPYTR